MITITTLGPSVRLVVFQFLMRNDLVPAEIPHKRASDAPPLSYVSGKEVLRSTPKTSLSPLLSQPSFNENYKLVDAWEKPHESKWNMSFVRFVFCHKEHVKDKELFPDFVAKRDNMESVLTDLVNKNLWATQGHLNRYFENSKPSGQQVLMLGCAGRVPNDWVFSGGRDEINRGIGPKVLLSALSHGLILTTSNEVVLAAPEPIEEE